jgi:hypothetical protein
VVERDENNHARKRNLPPSQVPRRIAKRVAAMVAVIDKVGPFRGNALGEVDGMALSRAYHGSELKRLSRAVAANYQAERSGHRIVTVEILWVFEKLVIHRSKQTVIYQNGCNFGGHHRKVACRSLVTAEQTLKDKAETIILPT